MRAVKKLDKVTRRKRQQWRDSKRRSRARERAYKDAMRQEAFAPVDVQLGGIDLSPWVQSVEVIEDRDVVEVPDWPDEWRRSVPGLRHSQATLSLLSNGIEDVAERILNSWSRQDEVQFTVKRHGRTVYDGPVLINGIKRTGRPNDVVNVEVKLTATGPGVSA